MKPTIPHLVSGDRTLRRAERLSRKHDQFNEAFIQELLAEHPDLLPVRLLRPDAGNLLCIGREVPTRSGSIDNLYLSSTGYVVVVETKLWRNPQSRREVFGQLIDYVQNVVKFDWKQLEDVWNGYRGKTGQSTVRLFDAIGDLEDQEHEFIERVEHALRRGELIGLVVGDGIDPRLQDLFSHFDKTTHLGYSLGVVSLHCYQMPGSEGMLVLPELVQSVEPVQRAYIRIELTKELTDLAASVEKVVRLNSEDERPVEAERLRSDRRIMLNEDVFFGALSSAVGRECSDRVRTFVTQLADAGLEPVFKSATLMLKVPAPPGKRLGASLLALEKSGFIYNSDHGPNQMGRWDWTEDRIDATLGKFWRDLHALDSRFSLTGISHLNRREFLPLTEVLPHLDEIQVLLEETAREIDRMAEEG
jgi:hypothetical protein